MKADATQHKMYSDTLVKEIASLKAKIVQMNKDTDKLKAQHGDQLTSKDKKHADTMKSHEKTLDALKKGHSAELSSLDAASRAEKEQHAAELTNRTNE